MKMESLEAVTAKDGVEEAQERRHQPDKDAMQKKGVEGAAQGFWLGRANSEHRLSPLLLLHAVSWSTTARCFSSAMVDKLRAGSNQGAEHAVGAGDFAFSVAVEHELGGEVR